MHESLKKDNPLRASSSNKNPAIPKPEPQKDEINLLKPNFMKKKEKPNTEASEEKANKLYEKMWEDDEESKREEERKKKEEERKKKLEEENKKREEEKRKEIEAEESKKKPFNLKKNRMNN